MEISTTLLSYQTPSILLINHNSVPRKMAAKFILVLCVALFSVAFAMPAAQPNQVEPKETMKPAETSHLHLPFSFGFGAGYPVARYSPYPYRGVGVSVGYSGLGYGYPYYNLGSGYSDGYEHYLPHY